MEMEDGRCLRADVSGPRTESGKGQGRDTEGCVVTPRCGFR